LFDNRRRQNCIFVLSNESITMKKKVIVGLSGGVDSSVAAYLLQQQGYEVIGLFMKNWHDDSVTISDECPWLEDSNDALIVAEKLGIPFQTVDLSKEYKERIVDYMFNEYERGRTPNPDVLCNREIKFDVFLNIALDLGADFVATGHYCRKEIIQTGEGNEIYRLLAGSDTNKDQSYFLCRLTKDQLKYLVFPLSCWKKQETYHKAASLGFDFHGQESQDVCFLSSDLASFFASKGVEQQPGDIISKDGQLLGRHKGLWRYTIGQRRGLGLPDRTPWYVISLDSKRNALIVGKRDDLLKRQLLRQGLCLLRIYQVTVLISIEIMHHRKFLIMIIRTKLH